MREKIEIPTTPFHSRPDQNVHGWERAGSLATGVLMVGKGLRRGGLFGLIQMAIGGAVLARGITGHCSAKGLMERGRADLDQIRSRIERSGSELKALKASAEAATREVTVTGNDSLSSPNP